MWLAVLGFMVMGLVSGLSLANHSDSESFLVVHALFSQDGCQRGFWEVVWHVMSPFDLSRTLLVGGGLLVPCSLPGPPVIRHSYKWLLCCLARVGGFSQCASPSSVTDPNPSCVLDIVLPYSPSCKWWFFLPKNVVSAPFPLHYLMPPKSYTWRIRWSENEGFWWVGLD